MRKYFVSFGLLFFVWISTGQENKIQKLNSNIKEVTVFLNNAQITRYKKVNLPKGESILRFTGLSPFINPESIRVSASGPVMILSVNKERNYKQDEIKPPALVSLEKEYRQLKDKIAEAETRLALILDEIDFLQRNKILGGKNQTLTVQALNAMETYYAVKMKELRFKKLKQDKNIAALRKKLNAVGKEIKKIADNKIYPPYEIIVNVSVDKPVQSLFKLTYNVKQASWFPGYDIRVDDIAEPLKITYKANIKQATQVDWEKVYLSLSSTNPTVSNEIPHLIPYRLGYNNSITTYRGTFNKVAGIVVDAGTGEPLPGVNVLIKGTSIGTVTDFDGRYSLTLPEGKENTLVFSYVGYNDLEVPAINPVINVKLEAGEQLESVVIDISGIEGDGEGDLFGGSGYVKKKQHKKTKDPYESPRPIPLERIDKQTSIHFKIKRAYTILSNNLPKIIPVIQYEIPAKYQYIAVPKMHENAFLTAQLTDWEQYNLLSGEAQVFIDGTSVGKTLLDTGLAKDTLEVSLGIDKGIQVTRELDKKYTGRKFLGTKRTETRKWHLIIKNNKNRMVNVKIIDQVPVSDRSDVEVEIIELSGGKLNPETGEVVWEITLSPAQKQDLILHYEVKLPKYSALTIE